jgi:AbrB family looped-hinge helix DNA binding protein
MKVTERGQITIPKELRKKYGITAASEIELIDQPEGILIVKRVSGSPFRKALGKATARGLPATTDEFLDLVRDGDEAPLRRRKGEKGG